MSVFYTACILAVILGLFMVWTSFQARRRRDAKPPVTVAEFDAMRAKYQAGSLPQAKLVPQEKAPQPMQTRLGGGPWVPDADTGWPMDADGLPRIFLGQVNFAEVSLPDFPKQGLLQFFATSSDQGHPDGPDYGEEDILHVCWYDTPNGGTVLPVPDSLTQAKHPAFITDRARRVGVAVVPEPQTVLANPYSYPFDEWEIEADLMDRIPADDAAQKALDGWEFEMDAIRDSFGIHWVGGHPHFVQGDPRGFEPELKGYDRVLFQMGFDDDVCLGDAGELSVLIKRDDLLAKRFDRAVMTWDCH